MGILVSAILPEGRTLSTEEVHRLAAVELSLSEGNWRQHLSALFLPSDGLQSIDAVERATSDFLAYYEGKDALVAQGDTAWHLGIARKLQALAAVARRLGATEVGSLG
jgi:hypothetical protein